MWNSVLEDSSIVQDWLARAKQEGKAEGKAEGSVAHARTLLLRQGAAKFGSPDADSTVRIEMIEDVEQLDKLLLRLLSVNSWLELLSR